MDICGKCRAPLIDAEANRLGEDHADDAANAALLASPNAPERRRALDMLPAPFCHWEAGEVFAAVVEVGALAIGDAPDRVGLVRAIKNGDFSAYKTSDLVRGYRFIKRWPQSLTDELRRLAVDEAVKNTLQLPVLAGPFGKYFYKSNSLTPLTALMRKEVPPLLYSLGVAPLRTSGCCPDWIKKGDTITQNEAIKMFKLDASTLRRLHGDGQCIVMVRGGVGHLYTKEALHNSVATMRSAARGIDCAKELGIPLHCVSSLRDAGLLSCVEDRDALLLAGVPLFDPLSLQVLQSRLRNVPVVSEPGTQTLQTLLRGRFHPGDWADAIAAILSGDIGIARRSKSGPILTNGILEEKSAQRFLASIPHRDLPNDVVVSADTASKMIGVTHCIISRAASLGLLKVERGHNPLRINLVELARFHQAYISGAEGDQCFSLKRGGFSRRMRMASIAPVAKSHSNTFWDRSAVASVLLGVS
jgi:hypothetical protein